MRRRGVILVIIAWAWCATVQIPNARLDANDAPTAVLPESIGQIRTTMESGDPDSALAMTQALLQQRSKSKARDGIIQLNDGVILTLSELHGLRGECLLAKRDVAGAKAAFRAAAEQATGENPASPSVDAHLALICASRGTSYVPRPAPDGQPARNPIDIIDRDSRRHAMQMLWDDLSPPLKTKVERAVADGKLRTMTELIAPLNDLGALERTATGNSERTASIVEPLGERMARVLRDEVQRKKWQVLALRAKASRMNRDEDINGDVVDIDRVGLNTLERKQMKGVVDDLHELASTALRLERLLQPIAEPGGTFDADAAETPSQWQKIADDAHALAQEGQTELEWTGSIRGGQKTRSRSR